MFQNEIFSECSKDELFGECSKNEVFSECSKTNYSESVPKTNYSVSVPKTNYAVSVPKNELFSECSKHSNCYPNYHGNEKSRIWFLEIQKSCVMFQCCSVLLECLFSINEEDWKSLHRRLISQRNNYEVEQSMGAEFLAVTGAMICTQPLRSFAIFSPIQCTEWSN